MNLSLFSTLRGYRKEYLPKDIFSGIIIAAVSIPISMGYAQISVIPAVQSEICIDWFVRMSIPREIAQHDRSN